jgi:hypothetical protein
MRPTKKGLTGYVLPFGSRKLQEDTARIDINLGAALHSMYPLDSLLQTQNLQIPDRETSENYTRPTIELPEDVSPGRPVEVYNSFFMQRPDVFEARPVANLATIADSGPLSEATNNLTYCTECGGDVVEVLGDYGCGACGIEIFKPFGRRKFSSEMTQEEKDEREINIRNQDNDVRSNIE